MISVVPFCFFFFDMQILQRTVEILRNAATSTRGGTSDQKEETFEGTAVEVWQAKAGTAQTDN